MDKCCDRICSYICAQLEILVNTRSLTLSIPEDKRENLVKIILTAWNNARKSFTLREIATLLGIVAHLAIATQW